MLRELDTEAACQDDHMSASRASFVFPTSSIPSRYDVNAWGELTAEDEWGDELRGVPRGDTSQYRTSRRW